MAEGGLSFSSSEESSPEMPRKARPIFTLNDNPEPISILKHKNSDMTGSSQNGLKGKFF